MLFLFAYATHTHTHSFLHLSAARMCVSASKGAIATWGALDTLV